MWNHCQVANRGFEAGFPCYIGDLPQRNRKKKKDGNDHNAETSIA